MQFTDEEISHLIKAWAAISLAFTIASTVGSSRFGGNAADYFIQVFIISSLTVGLAFLLHEIAHKFVAQKFGCWAEFRSFDMGLILALVMSLTGFIFAAPGAVLISGAVSTSENGKIAAAGPLTNIILAALFAVALNLFPVTGFWQLLLQQGVRINAWLAVFNLIPFWQLDGLKVVQWNTGVWLLLLAGGLIFMQ